MIGLLSKRGTSENKGSNVLFGIRNKYYISCCASVDNHIPQDDIFDYHPRRECNIYIISSILTKH